MKDFYDLFSGSYIQTFDDEKKGRKELVTAQSFFSADMKSLQKLNNAGAGIFFTPNPCSGGRKEENVTAINWIYIDMDGGDKKSQWARLLESPLDPTIIVESRNGYHAYWRCDLAKDQFRDLVERLIYFYNADPAISSINEVLRLPGFYHVKNRKEPFKIEIKHLEDARYTPDEMFAAFEAPMKQTQRKFALGDDSLSVIKDIPIRKVLEWLGVDVRRNQVFENGAGTSAMVNEKGNYITRFSGKGGSGSTIDAVMAWGNMDLKSAIDWLKEKAGVVKRSPAEIARDALSVCPKKAMACYYTWGTPRLTETFAPIKRDTYAIIGGGYGVGKTPFCVHLAISNVELGHRVLYLSLEMDNEEIYDHLARKAAGWEIPEEIYNSVPDYKQDKYHERRRELEEMKGFTLRGVRAGVDVTWEVLIELMKGDFDLVVVDNFNLVVKDKNITQYEHEARLSARFLQYSSQNQTPLLVVHHYSKGGARETEKTGYSLSGNAKIMNDAQRIVLLERKSRWDDDESPTPEEKAALKVILDKGRSYDRGVVKTVYFYKGAFFDKYPDEKILNSWVK